MKKRKAIFLAILLIAVISVIALISITKHSNNNKYETQTEEKASETQAAVKGEKKKNKPKIKTTEDNEEITEKKAEETEKAQASHSAMDIDSSAESNSEETIGKKAMAPFEESVNELSPVLGADGGGESAAGSFWDEPLVQSVYSRFSSSEIALAMQAASGNLSGSEKKAVKDMIYGRVSASEIAELERLYQLHGGQ